MTTLPHEQMSAFGTNNSTKQLRKCAVFNKFIVEASSPNRNKGFCKGRHHLGLCIPKVYQRRHPQSTILYQIVQNYFEDWLANYFLKNNETLPGFVESEFRDYFKCGITLLWFCRERAVLWREILS